MTIARHVDDFRRRALRIDSLEMTLRQRATEAPIVFGGCGEVVQTDRDEIRLRLYADVCAGDEARLLGATLASASGALIPETAYFDLIAKAIDGRTWSSEWVRPSITWSSGKAVVEGRLRGIMTEADNVAGRSSCKLYFFDDVELWWEGFSTRSGPGFEEHSRDHTKIEVLGMEMEFRKRDGHLTVTIVGDEIIPDVEMRVTEALRFILAREVICRISLRGEPDGSRVEFRAANQGDVVRSSLPTPIARDHDGWHDSSWTLFKTYLEYVHRHARPGTWHLVSYHLHNAREAAVAVDLWTMGACVAVEGLSHLLEAPVDAATEAKLNGMRAALTGIAEANAEWKPFAERVRQSLNLLFTKSVKDRLYPLVDRGLINRAHVQGWGRLRNKHVHPKAADVAQVSRQDSQAMMDGAFAMTVLMYTVVFAVIGYEGKFTDYSTFGFPTRRLPEAAWTGTGASGRPPHGSMAR